MTMQQVDATCVRIELSIDSQSPTHTHAIQPSPHWHQCFDHCMSIARTRFEFVRCHSSFRQSNMVKRSLPTPSWLPSPLHPRIRRLRAKAMPRKSIVKACISQSTRKLGPPIGSATRSPRTQRASTCRPSVAAPSSGQSPDHGIAINWNRPSSDFMLCIDCRLARPGGPLYGLSEAVLGRVIGQAMYSVLWETTKGYLEPWNHTHTSKTMFKLSASHDVNRKIGYELDIATMHIDEDCRQLR